MRKIRKEYHAWKKIASCIKRGFLDEDGDWVWDIGYARSEAVGLCNSIYRLLDLGVVDTTITVRMKNRIHQYKKRYCSHKAYFWPTNKKGSLKRISLCEKFALQAAKEEENAKLKNIKAKS